MAVKIKKVILNKDFGSSIYVNSYERFLLKF